MTGDPVVQARTAFGRQAWGDAYDVLSADDGSDTPGADDLDLLGTAAHLTGRVEAAADAWARAYQAWLDDGEVARAVRRAFWLAFTLMQRGDHARGGGWLARGQRLLDDAALDCVEQGYLRIPGALQSLHRSDADSACHAFEQIVAIADRFGDSDLMALGRLGHGQALLVRGEAARGTAMLDEAMLSVTTGQVSTIAAGIVYCGVIIACREVFDLGRAQEWTAALSRWCASQQDLKPFRGQCLVHRSEIMQLRGEWPEALDEVRRACEHLADPPGDPVLGMALYQHAELLRLRGRVTLAEETYRRANRSGHPAQPGLALLRLAQGRIDDAWASIRRVVADPEGDVERVRGLAAFIEIALAAGDGEAARTATEELGRVAADLESPYLHAVVEQAAGSVLLADGDSTTACKALRRASIIWQDLDVPYEAARVRVQLARACLALRDRDTAMVELDAARQVFEELGAAPALAQLRAVARSVAPTGGSGLTAREVEVLRLVATGATNREIASTLVISDKTVARHIANMFTKLGISTRAAATAYAYEHDLV